MNPTHPVPDVEETLLARQIEHEEESHGIPEESRRQTAKPGNGEGGRQERKESSDFLVKRGFSHPASTVFCFVLLNILYLYLPLTYTTPTP